MQLFTQSGLLETEIHDILRNDRRRAVLKHLRQTTSDVTLRDLAEGIAEIETGESPPPKNIRESVYNSLHQTHLPKLDERGVISYDKNRKTIALEERARAVNIYMEVVTKYGITWADYYRGIATLSLLTVLAVTIGVPGLSEAGTLLVTSGFLLVVALSTLYQLWTQRWLYLRQLVG
ncbi:hypothetical protein SAMN04487949_2529 [Halogranum gelatinilyticum]|uniref:DUF7344 domain-containing protein n=1 Tax=Halogranum gelatinilyticum TaxID=660521 RepID=A0A1G9VWT1_9EURY|nr:hypothetical protein [Halogranum gelatinilyticum]SDM76357.1 hypothetical protein SAMN04487949_2529 [Halogranum gelatinilyticum]